MGVFLVNLHSEEINLALLKRFVPEINHWGADRGRGEGGFWWVRGARSLVGAEKSTRERRKNETKAIFLGGEGRAGNRKRRVFREVLKEKIKKTSGCLKAIHSKVEGDD